MSSAPEALVECLLIPHHDLLAVGSRAIEEQCWTVAFQITDSNVQLAATTLRFEYRAKALFSNAGKCLKRERFRGDFGRPQRQRDAREHPLARLPDQHVNRRWGGWRRP